MALLHRRADRNLAITFLVGSVVIRRHLGGQLRANFYLVCSTCSEKTKRSPKG